MRRLFAFLICAVLWLLCAPLCRAQPALTTISDTLYNIDGSLMDGNIIVTNAAFSVGGVPIARGARAFPITNGVVNIQLTPTDHASPAIVYTVNTVSNGQTSTSIWSVPTLPSSRCPSGTCTIVQVTTLYTPGPTTTVALSQLSTQGATNGQMICDTAGAAVWCNPPAGGVTSFDGRTGAISPSANDYNFNQLAGAASVGQLPTGIPASNIGGGGVGNTAFGYVANLTSDAQAQLNAKLAVANNLSDVGSPATALSNLGGLPKGAVITWIDQYCSVPGIYDDTCFSRAFGAAGSTSNVTFMMGPNTYTLQNGLSISSATGWTIMGLKARSKLTVKNGLNTAMFTLNSTTDFAMRDVFADGNYPNQTSETSVISATGIVGLILEGNRFANVKGRAVVVSNSAYDFTDGLSIVDNIISGTTDSALYLALRYDGLTITGNRIDGIGLDGSNPQKAAAIYITHGGANGGLQMVGYSGNYIMASPNVNGNTYLQYGIVFDAVNGPAVNDLSNSYTNVGTNCGSINGAMNCVAGVVSSAFARAIKWGLVSVNPVTNSERPKVKRHRGIALTPAQQRMVIEAATAPWCLRTYLEIVAATGCRRGEVLALRWSDVQDGRAMIARSLTQTREVLEFKTTKTEEPRVVTLPVSAIAVLDAHRLAQNEYRRQFGPDYRADLDLIFANPDGTPLKPDSISSAVSLLFRRLKLPKGTSLHSLRHTHTSHLLASGVPLTAVSARLGHASIRTTQEIYSHMIHGQDDEAARKWEEFQNQQAGGTVQQKQVQ